jgi:hypothetical protein
MTNASTNCATFFLYASQLQDTVALDEANFRRPVETIFVPYATCFILAS